MDGAAPAAVAARPPAPVAAADGRPTPRRSLKPSPLESQVENIFAMAWRERRQSERGCGSPPSLSVPAGASSKPALTHFESETTATGEEDFRSELTARPEEDGHGLEDRKSSLQYLSTTVHINGVAVWEVRPTDSEDDASEAASEDLEVLSVMVHVDGEAVWEVFGSSKGS